VHHLPVHALDGFIIGDPAEADPPPAPEAVTPDGR
jgi:hypothetical protein